MLKKHSVSKDPKVYEAFPDLVLTDSGKLICVFTECAHHSDRSFTRIVICESRDRGISWSEKTGVTEKTGSEYSYDCSRIGKLKDGRIYILINKLPHDEQNRFVPNKAEVLIIFSENDGSTWSEPVSTPVRGIVPDKLLELENGRWIISAHYPAPVEPAQFLWFSDDQGKTWSEQIVVGQKEGLKLCEVSILPCGNNTLVAFMRENSGFGLDCMKTISYDNGETWGDVINFPLPGCHRPVAGSLQDGSIMITYRFMQGGKGWLGKWTQNFFAALTDEESALATSRNDSWTRIMPIDFDRSPKADLGYSGWVQFDDGEIYIVNYIVDDAIDMGQIRGYSLSANDFCLPR